MKCNNCGTINEEGIFFCCKCGESLKAQTAGQPQAEMKTCSSCGKQSPKTSSYCGYCGAKLPEEEDPENESSGPAPIYTLSMVDKYVGDIFIGISRSGGVLKVFNDRVEYHIKRYEYVRDTAKLVRKRGMVNVLVTNGTAELSVLEELIPYIDAMNIDLKGFTDRYYKDVLGGDRGMVMRFISEAVKHCHVELTTLIVPGENDSVREMEELSAWVAGLTGVYGGVDGREIPLHITRFFPRFRMQDREATDVGQIRLLVETAKKYLKYVYRGNC